MPIPIPGEDQSQTFQAIGEFVFAFSQLEFTIRFRLQGALGLTEEQSTAVMASYDFRVLCTVTRAILTQKTPTQQSSIEAVFNECLTLNNDKRVPLAHGTWVPDGEVLTAQHVSRNSLKRSDYFVDPTDLKRATDTARRLMTKLIEAPW